MNQSSLPPVWLADGPNGTTAKMTNAGATTRQGARTKAHLTARCGMTSSLTSSLATSAIGCSSPQGPTRLGPTRTWMKPSTLRSASTR